MLRVKPSSNKAHLKSSCMAAIGMLDGYCHRGPERTS
jgi:hypothetical protein